MSEICGFSGTAVETVICRETAIAPVKPKKPPLMGVRGGKVLPVGSANPACGVFNDVHEVVKEK